MDSVLETLKQFQVQARERADELLNEAQALEDYANNLQPVIEAVERMPEIGTSVISKLQPPKQKQTVPARRAGDKHKSAIYSVLVRKQLTIVEIAHELSVDQSTISKTVCEDVEQGILEKFDRYDGRKAVRIKSEEIRKRYAQSN